MNYKTERIAMDYRIELPRILRRSAAVVLSTGILVCSYPLLVRIVGISDEAFRNFVVVVGPLAGAIACLVYEAKHERVPIPY
jgi:hypothetical protein